MRLPRKENIRPTEIADPLKFYYLPLARSFFLKRLKMASAELPPDRCGLLLDIGCGSGIFLKELEGRCRSLHAIDVHRKMHLVKDMTVRERIRAHLAEASVLALPYRPQVFDCLISLSVLEHVRDLEQAFAEIGRVSKKGARIILGFPVKNPLTDLVLRLAYLFLPQAKLEEEHVSDQNKIIRAARRSFRRLKISYFPSFLPRSWSFYCLVTIIKS